MRDGTAVEAVSSLRPDIGFYLDDIWVDGDMLTSPGLNLDWLDDDDLSFPARADKMVVYPWPDYAAPSNLRELVGAAKWLMKMAADGAIVEIGCIGGHGRTGTMLATMLVVAGKDPLHAAHTIRRQYCGKSIESTDQMHFLRQVWAHLRGEPAPTWDETNRIEIARDDRLVKQGRLPKSKASTADDFKPAGEGVGLTAEQLIAADREKIQAALPKDEQQGRGASAPDSPTLAEQLFDEEWDPDIEQYEAWWERNMAYLESENYSQYERHLDSIRDEMRQAEHQFEEREESMRRAGLDRDCKYGPCLMPSSCCPSEGDCFFEATREMQYVPSEVRSPRLMAWEEAHLD